MVGALPWVAGSAIDMSKKEEDSSMLIGDSEARAAKPIKIGAAGAPAGEEQVVKQAGHGDGSPVVGALPLVAVSAIDMSKKEEDSSMLIGDDAARAAKSIKMEAVGAPAGEEQVVKQAGHGDGSPVVGALPWVAGSAIDMSKEEGDGTLLSRQGGLEGGLGPANVNKEEEEICLTQAGAETTQGSEAACVSPNRLSMNIARLKTRLG